MHVNGRPVAAFDPEGLIFAAGVDSEMVKLYDLRSFDKVIIHVHSGKLLEPVFTYFTTCMRYKQWLMYCLNVEARKLDFTISISVVTETFLVVSFVLSSFSVVRHTCR